ncbi:putative DNA-binding transcriptional regulator YafY [Paenibacillus jamilae]|nr:putative DNA-binding transcriptional regulator YafY [Paenibacillus jamilae]
MDFNKKLMFEYKNYKGEVSLRHVYPQGIRYGSTEWHPEEQWLLKAWDYAKGEYREFAMKDILEFM